MVGGSWFSCPILHLRHIVSLGLRDGVFPASPNTPSPGSRALPCICGGFWEEEGLLPLHWVADLCLALVQDPGAQGNQGLMAFASALPPEAMSLCLVTLTGTRESPAPSCSLPRGFYAPGSRRVCCPFPCSLRLLFPLRGGSWKRAGFQACPPAVAHHLLPVTFCSLVPPMGTLWCPALPWSFSWALGGGLHRIACK